MAPKKRKKTALGARLNHVRQLVGAQDLKSFYKSLEGVRLPSYPAVCTYHADPWRDPPTPYLARIVEVYPAISLDWLVTGRGSTRESFLRMSATRASRVSDAFADALHGLPIHNDNASLLALEGTILRYLHERTRGGDLLDASGREDAEVEVAGRIGRAAQAAIDVLGDPGEFYEDEMTSFLVLFCLAAREWADPAERQRRGEKIQEDDDG